MASMTTDQLQTNMQNLQNDMNANQFGLYKMSAENSFAQSLAQTYGQLEENAAKAKPQV